MPVGFLLNDVQYYYVTDLSGNVKGITDANGELVASYEYDEWGKLLALTPAEDGNEEQIAVATKNPLRYRGYYYDNETGLYYLQSRYYSPDLCRFISPDDFDYINNSSTLYLNAYAYCYNNAVSLSDAEGTTPQLAMNVADISAFVKHIGAKVKETAKESLEKAKALLNETVEKLKETWAKLEEKRSKTLEDLKYFIKYPDVVINNALSKLLNKEVKIRFRLVELIRKAVKKAELTKAEKSSSDDNSNSSSKAKAKAKLKTNAKDSLSNAGKVVVIIINEIFTCLDLQEIAKQLHRAFNFSKLSEYLQLKVDLYREAFDKGIIKSWTSENSKASSTASWLSSIASLFDKIIPKNISKGIAALPYFPAAIDDLSGRYITPVGAFIMLLFDGITNGTIDVGSAVISAFSSPIVGTIVSALFGAILGVLDTRSKAEFIAYNWWYYYILDLFEGD